MDYDTPNTVPTSQKTARPEPNGEAEKLLLKHTMRIIEIDEEIAHLRQERQERCEGVQINVESLRTSIDKGMSLLPKA